MHTHVTDYSLLLKTTLFLLLLYKCQIWCSWSTRFSMFSSSIKRKGKVIVGSAAKSLMITCAFFVCLANRGSDDPDTYRPPKYVLSYASPLKINLLFLLFDYQIRVTDQKTSTDILPLLLVYLSNTKAVSKLLPFSYIVMSSNMTLIS